MRNRKQIVIFAFLMGAVIFLAGCKSTRSVIKEPIKEEGPEYLIGKLGENELEFEWLSAKFSASYTSDKSTNDFKGQIRIKKDSLIWISISPALGIEMMRLTITPDSVKYMNRFDKTWFAGDLSLIQNFLGANIDFDIVQSFLIGNDFQLYEKGSFRASIDSKEYRLATTHRRKIKKGAKDEDDPLILVHTIWLNPETFKITRANVKEYAKENIRLSSFYSDFEELFGQIIPLRIKIQVSGDENLELKAKYSKISIDQPLSFPFRIPSKYEEIK